MPNRRRPVRVRALIAVTSAALFGAALTGCDSSSSDSRAAGDDKKGASVIAPGRPGEEAERISPEEAAAKRDDDTPNAADFAYAEMMIEHHAQAIVLTDLAPDRAESTKVKRLAERIGGAQGPEIKAMEGWLKNHDADKRPKKDGGAHGHHGGAGMPGMATEAQIKTLRASKGAAFDELFLKLMIKHHEGAVAMATDLLSQGNNIQIEEMATDVVAQQTSEINRMRDLP